TSVSLSDQGLVQVLEASVTGLEPGKPYMLALSSEASGAGVLQPLQGFMTNPAGSAIVNAIGPIRQIVRGEDKIQRRYLVIAPGARDQSGTGCSSRPAASASRKMNSGRTPTPVPSIRAGNIASPLFTRSGPDGRTVAAFPFLVKRQVSGVIV